MTGFQDSVFAQAGRRMSQQNIGLRTLVLLLVALAVLPLFVIVGVTWRLEQRSQIKRAEQNLSILADLFAASQEQLVEGTRQMLAVVSSAPVVVGGDGRACSEFLARVHGKYPGYVTLGVIDVGGMLACHSMPQPPAVMLGDRAYFERALRSGQFSVGDYMVGRVTGAKTLPFGMPVQGLDGALKGVAFVGLDLRVLHERLKSVPLPQGVAAYVTDGKGVILASTHDDAGEIGRVLADPWLLGAIIAGQKSGAVQTTGSPDQEQMNFIKAISPRGGGGLSVVVSAHPHELLASATSQLALVAGALFVFLVLYVAMMWWLIDRWLLGPVRKLMAGMRLIEGGGYLGPAAQPRTIVREVQVLNAGLNAMSQGLDRRRRERDDAFSQAMAARAEMLDILNQMDDGFMVLDWGWHVTFCNRRGAQLMRRPLRELDNADFWSLLPDLKDGQARRDCEREVMRRRPWAFEEFHAHYGSWFEIRLFPSEDGIGVFLRDSTRRWEMFNEQVERERRYRELFEANPNMMWIFDTQTLKFLAVNDAAVRRYGYSREAFLAMSIEDVHPSEDVEELREVIGRAEPDMTLMDESRIWRHLTHDGELVLVEVVRHPITFNGRPARLVMITDATQRLVTASKLRQRLDTVVGQRDRLSEELAAARQVVDGYVHLITQELRAPLNLLQQLARQLEDGRIALAADAAEGETASVLEEARRATLILEGVSRLAQAERLPLHRQPVDLARLVDALLPRLEARRPGRRIHLEMEPSLPCEGDPELLQILMEVLLDNAWKYSAGRADAWVRVGGVLAEGSGVVTFFVSDNGTGFPSADASRLFVPFQRQHAAAEFEGFGLGLAAAAIIVARHQGRIWAESGTDRGATFHFELAPRPGPQSGVNEVMIDSMRPEDD